MKPAFRFSLIYKLLGIFLLLSLMPSGFGSNTSLIAHAKESMPGTKTARQGLVFPKAETYAEITAPALRADVRFLVGDCYLLTLDHNGAGSAPTATPEKSMDCTALGEYNAGEVITLTAHPDPGYSVSGWAGATNANTELTNTVTMPADVHTVTVNYVANCYTLTLTPSGPGGVLEADPASSGGCPTGQYIVGTPISLTAHPDAGYSVSWDGTDDDNSTSTTNAVTMPANAHAVDVTYFPICYSLASTHNGTGSDPAANPTNSPGCDAGKYTVGQSITMTATPGTGQRVSSWGGTTNDASTDTSNTVSMPPNDHIVTVNYAAVCYTLARDHTGTGSDPVADPANSPSCDAGQYVYGATVTMTATPGTGQRVDSWEGTTNDASTDTTNTVSMPASNHTVTVNYESICYTLTRNFSEAGSAPTADPLNSLGCPEGKYIVGESITMTAHPAIGYSVGSWNGTTNDASTSLTNTVSMPASHHVVTANYVAICYSLTREFTGLGSAPTADPLSSGSCPEGKYIVGESITMTAHPAEGYEIVGWDGTTDDNSTSLTNTVTMPAGNHIVAVNYQAICFTLTRTAVNTGSDPIANPTKSASCSNPDEYIVGESIMMTASPGVGYAVGSWVGTINDASTSTINTVIMPASNHTVTVNYVAVCYTLTRTFTGTGFTTTGSAPTASPLNSTGCPAGQYHYNQSISLTANPAAGYEVSGWDGTNNNASTSNNNTATMPASDHTVTANYIAICYTLTRTYDGVGTPPEATPTKSSSCSSGQYIVGESITLKDNPGPGYHLDRWEGTDTQYSNHLAMPPNHHTVKAIYVTANDIYEPDNTYDQAKVINPGAPQTRSIIPREDVDWVKFTLDSTSAVTLEVIGPTPDDTRMWLYDSNLTQVAFSDDEGTGSYSLLSFACGVNPLPPGTYYAKIDEYNNNNEIPSYDTYLTTQSCPMARDTTGVFRPTNGIIFLKNSHSSGFADVGLNYGIPGDYPVVGDWDGDGDATIGVYRNGSFFLRNANTIGFADIAFPFGQPGDQPVAGDWDGDGIDTIGVYRPSNGQFLLRNSNSAGTADISFFLGNVGDVGIAGDWDGDGKDTTGVFRPINGIIFLKNTNDTGFADVALNYGIPGDRPIIGDWDNNGIDTIGVYRNGRFFLRNANTIGFADIVFDLGNPGDMPIAGNWDGEP